MRIDLTTVETARHAARRWATVAEGAVETVTGEPAELAVADIAVQPAAAVRARFWDRPVSLIGSAGDHVLVGAAVGDPDGPRRAMQSIGDLFLGRLGERMIETGVPINRPSVRCTSGEAVFDGDQTELLTCRFTVPSLGSTLDLVLPIVPPFDRLWDPVPIAEIASFSSLAVAGVAEAGRHASIVRDREVAVTPTAVRFPARATIEDDLTAHARVGFVAGVSEPPGGFVAFTVDRDAGRRLDRAAARELGIGPAGIVHGTVTDLGDAIVRGTLAGWTDLFGETIDCAAPRTLGPGADPTTLSDHTEWLPERRRHGLQVQATVETDACDIECDIVAMPNESSLLALLDREDVDSGRIGNIAHDSGPEQYQT